MGRTAELSLRERGLNVWWDAGLSVGHRYAEQIQAELEKAKAVVVISSHNSVGSTFVRDEAGYARDHQQLVPASIDEAPVPLGFRQFHTSDLTGWTGDPSSEIIGALASRLAEITGAKVKLAVNRRDSPWISVSREAARRHRLFGFSGASQWCADGCRSRVLPCHV